MLITRWLFQPFKNKDWGSRAKNWKLAWFDHWFHMGRNLLFSLWQTPPQLFSVFSTYMIGSHAAPIILHQATWRVGKMSISDWVLKLTNGIKENELTKTRPLVVEILLENQSVFQQFQSNCHSAYAYYHPTNQSRHCPGINRTDLGANLAYAFHYQLRFRLAIKIPWNFLLLQLNQILGLCSGWDQVMAPWISSGGAIDLQSRSFFHHGTIHIPSDVIRISHFDQSFSR